MVTDALFRVLHPGESRIVDPHSDTGAGLGAAHSGEWNWTGPDIAEPAADLGTIRAAIRADAAASRDEPARDCRGNALHFVGAGDDRPDDRPRRRPASGLGAVAANSGDRVGGSRRAGVGRAPDWTPSRGLAPFVHRGDSATGICSQAMLPSCDTAGNDRL